MLDIHLLSGNQLEEYIKNKHLAILTKGLLLEKLSNREKFIILITENIEDENLGAYVSDNFSLLNIGEYVDYKVAGIASFGKSTLTDFHSDDGISIPLFTEIARALDID